MNLYSMSVDGQYAYHVTQDPDIFDVFVLKQPFTQATATWDNVTQWETPTTASITTPYDFKDDWADYDVTTAINSFASGAHANNGFIMTVSSQVVGRVGIQYWSSDYQVDSLRPKLTLTISTSTPVVASPVVTTAENWFVGQLNVQLSCATSGAMIHYTTDGSEPTEQSTAYSNGFTINKSTYVRARAFKSGMTPSFCGGKYFTAALRAVELTNATNGVNYSCFENETADYPDWCQGTPSKTGTAANFDPTVCPAEENFSIEFKGYVKVPTSGVYHFGTHWTSGGVMAILLHDTILVCQVGYGYTGNPVVLEAGYQPIRLLYHLSTGGRNIAAFWGPETGDNWFQEDELFVGEGGQTDISLTTANQSIGNPLMVSEGHASISYTLPAASHVEILVYSSAGKLVQSISRRQNAGRNTMQWGENLSTGRYVLTLKACGLTYTNTIVIMR